MTPPSACLCGSHRADYLAQLSDHIKPESALQTDLHLDSQSFWKHAYEKREKEITRLQNRIFELEAQSTTVDDESSPWHRLDGLKRKAEAQTMTGVKANTQSKRRRMTDIKPKDCTATIHPLEQNGGIAEGDFARNPSEPRSLTES